MNQFVFFDMKYVVDAREFARIAHKDAKRKNYEFPYFYHVSQVESIVAAAVLNSPELLESYVDESHPHAWGGSYESQDLQELLAAALLHDVIEDTEHTEQSLRKAFTPKTVDVVVELTNVDKSAGNRAARKVMDNARLGVASKYAKMIKAADRWANLNDLTMSRARGRIDDGYYWKYLRESAELIPRIKVDNYVVWDDLNQMVKELLDVN